MNKSDNKKPGYPTFSEFRRKELLNIATAVGIGVTAATVPISLISEEKASSESKTGENDIKKTKDKIILLVANLGHDNYKERDNATKSLIVIGKNFTKTKNKEMIAFLNSELTKCNTSKDPEQKERAKKVLLAITPASPKRKVPRMMGMPPPPR